MKKIICSLALIFALTACSMNDVIALLVTPTAPPPPLANETLEPTVFYTPSQTPTGTQIPPFTFTPTLIGAGDPFEVPSDGTEALPTLILVPTATPGPQVALVSNPGSLFVSVSVSSDTLYWGYCDATKFLDFEVRLANNLRVGYVLLFLRLVDKGGNQSTGWGVGAIMKKTSQGYYAYHITPGHLVHYNEFEDAWLEYQVVTTTWGRKILESSPVYENTVSFQKCLTIEVDE
jgi:hypothetical protein